MKGSTVNSSNSASPAEIKSVARSADVQIVSAPVAAGFISHGPKWSFGPAPSRGGLVGVRLVGRQLWASIQTDSTPHLGNPIVNFAGSNVSSLTFDPDDTQTMPPPMTSLSQVFGRYALMKCRVVYTPANATSIGASLSIAALSDAGYVQQVWSGKTGGWSQTLMEQSNSSTAPIWQSMALDIPCDGALRFTYQSAADSSITIPEERQDHAFGLGASLQNGTSTLGASSFIGWLHLEYMVDFYEVISQSNEVSLRRLLKRADALKVFLEKQRSLEEKSSEKREEVAESALVPAVLRRTDSLKTAVGGEERKVSHEAWTLLQKRP